MIFNITRSNYRHVKPRFSYVFAVPWDLHHAGGVNQVVLNLYDEMLSAGEIKPLIMIEQWSAFRPIEREVDGRPTFYLRLWSPYGRGSIMRFIKWAIASPFWITHLLQFIRQHNVQAFNFHFPSLNVFPIAFLRFLRLYRGDFILSFHGADLHDAEKGGPVERKLWKFILNNTTAIVACSRTFAISVKAFAGSAENRVYAIQNGVNIDCFWTAERPNLPKQMRDRPFILSVATFEHKKGLDVLMRAFVKIRSTSPNIALALVGRSTGAEVGLRALAVELGISDDVFFFFNVPHPQVAFFFERAKVFCLPSRSEPFGIVILEAGVFRLPVVACLVGGIPEIITNGETGFLVPPDDVQALADALGTILNDTNLSNRLGNALYQCVRNNFSWKRAYNQYRELLE